jgi:hypothetical protein
MEGSRVLGCTIDETFDGRAVRLMETFDGRV